MKYVMTLARIVMGTLFLAMGINETASAESDLSTDNLTRRESKVSDPNSAEEVAKALTKPKAGLDPRQRDKAFAPRRTLGDPSRSIAPLLLYDAVGQGETVSDIGCVLRGTEDGRTLLEVSILTKGQGANFRRWVPNRPYVLADSERITPAKTEKFYVSRESLARPVAVIVFAALGSQYVGHAKKAEEAPGEPLEAEIEEEEHTGTAEAIDRVGMAAGMGLLASQASGQITGLKTTYDVTGYEKRLGKIRLKFQVVNNQTRQQLDVTVPLHFD